MDKKKVWKFRGNLSEATRDKVNIIQGELQAKGKKLTHPEVIDYCFDKLLKK